MPWYSFLVVNMLRGARVGVRVGVLVGVGVMVGLGVAVGVGEGVLLGVSVAVRVALGTMVQVGVEDESWPQEASQKAITNNNNLLNCFLRSDIKKRVMIIDLVMVDAKGIIPIADVTLGGAGCPGKVT
jgi:hypothetical protein